VHGQHAGLSESGSTLPHSRALKSKGLDFHLKPR
jgi:hypothetical protein